MHFSQLTTQQQIFDYVVTALAKQGRKASTPENGCRYRLPDGRKCAVGHLIPDNLYHKRMEGCAVCDLIEYMLRPALPAQAADPEWGYLRNFIRDESAFLTDLQEAHDDGTGDKLETRLFVAVAERYDLNTNLLDTTKPTLTLKTEK